jgi:hypothetical protein
MSAVPPCPPPIIATRLAVTFCCKRRGLFLEGREEELEGFGDAMHTRFRDPEQVENLYEQKACPHFIIRGGRNAMDSLSTMKEQNDSGSPGVLC